MIDYHKLLAFFDEYILHYTELLRFENDKLKMIVADNIKELEKSIGKEQALIMKTNSYENKRFELIGVQNQKKTFKEIIEEAPYEFQPRLNDRYNSLTNLVYQIKKINQNAQEIVAQRLTLIEEVKNGSVNSTYNKNGGKKNVGQGSMTLNKDI